MSDPAEKEPTLESKGPSPEFMRTVQTLGGVVRRLGKPMGILYATEQVNGVGIIETPLMRMGGHEQSPVEDNSHIAEFRVTHPDGTEREALGIVFIENRPLFADVSEPTDLCAQLTLKDHLPVAGDNTHADGFEADSVRFYRDGRALMNRMIEDPTTDRLVYGPTREISDPVEYEALQAMLATASTDVPSPNLRPHTESPQHLDTPLPPPPLGMA